MDAQDGAVSDRDLDLIFVRVLTGMMSADAETHLLNAQALVNGLNEEGLMVVERPEPASAPIAGVFVLTDAGSDDNVLGVFTSSLMAWFRAVEGVASFLEEDLITIEGEVQWRFWSDEDHPERSYAHAFDTAGGHHGLATYIVTKHRVY